MNVVKFPRADDPSRRGWQSAELQQFAGGLRQIDRGR